MRKLLVALAHLSRNCGNLLRPSNGGKLSLQSTLLKRKNSIKTSMEGRWSNTGAGKC